MNISERDIAFLKRDIEILRGIPNEMGVGMTKEAAIDEMGEIIDKLVAKLDTIQRRDG